MENSSHGNETICLVAFNIFAVLCIMACAAEMTDMYKEFNSSDPEVQDACHPLYIWKMGFLLHIIYFFLFFSFSVGAIRSYAELEGERDLHRYRRKFERMMENSMHACRGFCFGFCGPTVLVECILSAVYYKQIVNGCTDPNIDDSMKNLMIYFLICLGLSSLVVTGFCCYGLIMICKTIKEPLSRDLGLHRWGRNINRDDQLNF